MDRDYDIFEKLPDGSVLWRAFLPGLNNTLARLEELAKLSPNEHLDSQTKQAISKRSRRAGFFCVSAARRTRPGPPSTQLCATKPGYDRTGFADKRAGTPKNGHSTVSSTIWKRGCPGCLRLV